LERLSLGVQQALYSLDDLIAVGQEELEKFDMLVKRHLVTTLCGRPLRGREWMNRFVHSIPSESEAKNWLKHFRV
jgi:hypothetical protein